jgi:small subunit ribosomal protein S20
MPNTKSAKKELRKNVKRHVNNKKVKENIKTLIKKSRKLIDQKDEKAKELIIKTTKAIDKAAKKGIIKKNTGNRKKSRLQLKFNKTQKKNVK